MIRNRFLDAPRKFYYVKHQGTDNFKYWGFWKCPVDRQKIADVTVWCLDHRQHAGKLCVVAVEADHADEARQGQSENYSEE